MHTVDLSKTNKSNRADTEASKEVKIVHGEVGSSGLDWAQWFSESVLRERLAGVYSIRVKGRRCIPRTGISAVHRCFWSWPPECMALCGSSRAAKITHDSTTYWLCF